MIWNGEEMNYMQYKKGITLKNDGDFYYLNCLHSFRRKKNLESQKNVCEDKRFYNIAMSFEENKIIELNDYQKCSS